MKRIQRKRTKGFKLPPNTLVITRGTPFGNRWKVVKVKGGYIVTNGSESTGFPTDLEMAKRMAISNFEDRLTINQKQFFIDICENRGIENIACFCTVDSPCHGDVWLEVWNEYQSGTRTAESKG